MTFLTKIIGALALFVSATTAQIAFAQDRLDFDCTALLEASGFQQQNMFGKINRPLLSARNLAIPRNGDPINTNELLERATQPILARSNFEFDAQGQSPVLSCNIIVVDFFTSSFVTDDGVEAGRERVAIRANDGKDWGERLAILTIGTYETLDEAERALDGWSAKDYDLPAKFEDFDITEKTPIQSSTFLGFNLFPGTSWSSKNVDYVNWLNVDSDVETFLTDNGVLATTMLVFCGTDSCEDIASEILSLTIRGGQEQTLSTADPEPTPQARPDPLPETANP